MARCQGREILAIHDQDIHALRREQRQGELVNYGYSEETLHLVSMAVPPKAGESASIAAEAKWLVCSDVCIPGKAELTLAHRV